MKERYLTVGELKKLVCELDDNMEVVINLPGSSVDGYGLRGCKVHVAGSNYLAKRFVEKYELPLGVVHYEHTELKLFLGEQYNCLRDIPEGFTSEELVCMEPCFVLSTFVELKEF